MMRRFLPYALTLALFCPMAAFAQTPPVPATPPPAPAAPAAPAPKRAARVSGKISAVDASAKTVTLTRKKSTVTLSVPDGTKIYKIGDAKGRPTGTFADLTVDAQISVATEGDAAAPVAKTIHLRAPKGSPVTATP